MLYQTIINRLRNDEDYYGDFGKKWLSNSNIKTLLEDPGSFLTPKEDTIAMLQGRYFHTLLLEPDKVANFKIIDASTRNTNKYKEESEGVLTLLRGDVDMLKSAAEAIKGNYAFYEEIYDDDCEYEVPGVITLEEHGGSMWKGKADIKKSNKIIDIKTTTNIDNFKKSAYIYNYDSQSYIYEAIFGVPVEFFVVEKGTNRLGMFKCSHEFKLRGREKVDKAVRVYDRFFGDNAYDTIENYYIDEIL